MLTTPQLLGGVRLRWGYFLNENFISDRKDCRQFATVDPATEEVIAMVAEADRSTSQQFSSLLQ